MGTPRAKRILIAPLDWGLGHTTRCIPIIRHLTALGHQVVVAGTGAQLSLLRPQFPQLTLVPLEGYAVRYGTTRRGFAPAILRQLPRLLGVIGRERRWLQRLAGEQRIDGIISDNRYGLFHPKIPSVILTHQPRVLTGLGPIADALVRRLHYRLLGRFGQCWIPDVAGTPNLGGRLSHPQPLPARATYLGLLSHLQPQATGKGGGYLLVLLSGPEPQRTLLSRILWQQVVPYDGQVVFVEGSDDCPLPGPVPEHVRYHRRLTPAGLQPLLEGAGLVICRSGYSTLMDLSLLQQKAVLIPTPGQTEQEYLGRHLQAQGVHLCFSQEKFSLAVALAAAEDFPFRPLLGEGSHKLFVPVLEEWMDGL